MINFVNEELNYDSNRNNTRFNEDNGRKNNRYDDYEK